MVLRYSVTIDFKRTIAIKTTYQNNLCSKRNLKPSLKLK